MQAEPSSRASKAEGFYKEARSLMSQANDKLTSLAVFVAGVSFTVTELFGVERLSQLERILVLVAIVLNIASACFGVWVTLRVNEFLNKTGEAVSSSSPDATYSHDFDPWQFRAQLYTFVLGLLALIILIVARLA